MMKTNIIIVVLCLSLAFCSFNDKETESDKKKEPLYTAKIAWDSGLYSNSYGSHIVYEDFIYFYEHPLGQKEAGNAMIAAAFLTKALRPWRLCENSFNNDLKIDFRDYCVIRIAKILKNR